MGLCYGMTLPQRLLPRRTQSSNGCSAARGWRHWRHWDRWDRLQCSPYGSIQSTGSAHSCRLAATAAAYPREALRLAAGCFRWTSRVSSSCSRWRIHGPGWCAATRESSTTPYPREAFHDLSVAAGESASSQYAHVLAWWAFQRIERWKWNPYYLSPCPKWRVSRPTMLRVTGRRAVSPGVSLGVSCRQVAGKTTLPRYRCSA